MAKRGYRYICAMYGCTPKRDHPYKFHSFPKDCELATRWVKLCGRKDTINLKNGRICGKHFSDAQKNRNLYQELLKEDYKEPRGYRGLRNDAVPDQNLPLQTHLNEDLAEEVNSSNINLTQHESNNQSQSHCSLLPNCSIKDEITDVIMVKEENEEEPTLTEDFLDQHSVLESIKDNTSSAVPEFVAVKEEQQDSASCCGGGVEQTEAKPELRYTCGTCTKHFKSATSLSSHACCSSASRGLNKASAHCSPEAHEHLSAGGESSTGEQVVASSHCQPVVPGSSQPQLVTNVQKQQQLFLVFDKSSYVRFLELQALNGNKPGSGNDAASAATTTAAVNLAHTDAYQDRNEVCHSDDPHVLPIELVKTEYGDDDNSGKQGEDAFQLVGDDTAEQSQPVAEVCKDQCNPCPILPQSNLCPILPQSNLYPILPQSNLCPILPKSNLCPILPKSNLWPILPKSQQRIALPRILRRTHKCTVCSKEFVKKQCFTRHMNQHLKVKSFFCDVCSKTFAQRYELKLHKMTHSREKSYTCDVCGKSFRGKKNLSSHKSRHSCATPFLCVICGKKLRTLQSLNCHAAVHSRSTIVKCDFCDKSFTRLGLRSHLKRRHNIDTGVADLGNCPDDLVKLTEGQQQQQEQKSIQPLQLVENSTTKTKAYTLLKQQTNEESEQVKTAEINNYKPLH